MNRRENVAALGCGLAEELVRTFGEVRLRVFGTSMVPSILPGDLISVQRAGVSEISSGEVVLYVREGRMFVHRVVDRGVVACAGSAEHLLLITRGDRLRHNDPPVSSAELLGRVISIERGDQKFDALLRFRTSNGLLLRLLQTSDYATYLYVRLAVLCGSLVGRTFRSDKTAEVREGLLSPETSGAKAHVSLTLNVGAKAPTHKPDESFDGTFDGRLRTEDTEGAVECQA